MLSNQLKLNLDSNNIRSNVTSHVNEFDKKRIKCIWRRKIKDMNRNYRYGTFLRLVRQILRRVGRFVVMGMMLFGEGRDTENEAGGGLTSHRTFPSGPWHVIDEPFLDTVIKCHRFHSGVHPRGKTTPQYINH